MSINDHTIQATWLMFKSQGKFAGGYFFFWLTLYLSGKLTFDFFMLVVSISNLVCFLIAFVIGFHFYFTLLSVHKEARPGVFFCTMMQLFFMLACFGGSLMMMLDRIPIPNITSGIIACLQFLAAWFSYAVIQEFKGSVYAVRKKLFEKLEGEK